MSEQNQQEGGQENEGKQKKGERHILGEVAGGVCLASTMVSCLCLFFIGMLGLVA